MKSITSLLLENSSEFPVEEAEEFFRELSELFSNHSFLAQFSLYTYEDEAHLYNLKKKALMDPGFADPSFITIAEFIALHPPPPPLDSYPLRNNSYRIAGASSQKNLLFYTIQKYKQELEDLKQELAAKHIQIKGSGRPFSTGFPVIHNYRDGTIAITYPPYTYPLEEKIKQIALRYPKWKHSEGDPPEGIGPGFYRKLV